MTQIGVLLPSRETWMTGAHDAAGLVRFARAAEAAGFDSVWIGDSPLARTRVDPLPLLAAVAATTSRVQLGTAAYTATLRHPLLGAHTAATVDQLSDGRLILGLGAGFPVPESRDEFTTLGAQFDERVGRLDETVAIWRQSWSGATDFDGRYWKLDDLSRTLPAASPAGPPLWLASSDTPRVLDRVARHYDGWLPFLPDPDAYARAWTSIREKTTRPITPGLYATININPNPAAARAELDGYVRQYYRRSLAEMSMIQAYFGGSAEECAQWLGRYLDAGAAHLVLRIGSLDADRQLDLLAAALLPTHQAA
ncbi:LLM class flavin-dependent oxidoreductase [Nocardia sp. NBC_00565]|uniref:LLM class flavin-dependent oxidoreductase n=1 Tax=Nocardia sp. NBC_00565 TaxID=2975993 RepID=UPI002E80F3AC|nr:LLM class flavin-dependent oxidoreductase [Nocardia sp. NBC_00565]WUC06052.1 LLM class flavin-dependent oxidoreductase [Nocardia sp. NBC_00565]